MQSLPWRATHAIYPSIAPEDNIQNMELQGHGGNLAKCAACHDRVPLTTNGGSHSLHTVGQVWVKEHGDAAEDNQGACAYCHDGPSGD
jgi:hypothetical protein